GHPMGQDEVGDRHADSVADSGLRPGLHTTSPRSLHPAFEVGCHHRGMTQQLALVPTDAGAVVREFRGFGGVPWGRLFRYLRPNAWRFALAMVGLVFSSLIGLAFPLIIAGITTEVVAGGDSAG